MLLPHRRLTPSSIRGLAAQHTCSGSPGRCLPDHPLRLIPWGSPARHWLLALTCPRRSEEESSSTDAPCWLGVNATISSLAATVASARVWRKDWRRGRQRTQSQRMSLSSFSNCHSMPNFRELWRPEAWLGRLSTMLSWQSESAGSVS